MILSLSLSLPLALGSLVASPRSAAAHVDETTAVEVEVGSSEVRGKRLKPFDGSWTTTGGVTVTEVATIEKIDGVKRYVRRQVWPMGNPGLELHAELVLDLKTLATVSFQRKVVGLPAGASMGGNAELIRWDFDGADYKRTEHHGDEETVTEDKLAAPMFDGNGLGLVIAGLPLKKGYSARVPVAMTLSLGPELTTYSVELRVVGTEMIETRAGKESEAWIVEADWYDYQGEEITSLGGAENAGGAYYVLSKPKKGVPHVARYRNDSTNIELIPQS